ncbi:uncharacterized protein LOC134852940 [Symsagittifera roscoffensis]|uniref:uncharacterized protein LOC134852940 n=1 Tax=Symsagittifera roscoffensis TaxID=84072 RepID=UPI00307C3BFD
MEEEELTNDAELDENEHEDGDNSVASRPSDEVDGDSSNDEGEEDEDLSREAEDDGDKVKSGNSLAVKTPDQIKGEILDEFDRAENEENEKTFVKTFEDRKSDDPGLSRQQKVEMEPNSRVKVEREANAVHIEFRTRFDGVKVEFVTRDTQTGVDVIENEFLEKTDLGNDDLKDNEAGVVDESDGKPDTKAEMEESPDAPENQTAIATGDHKAPLLRQQTVASSTTAEAQLADQGDYKEKDEMYDTFEQEFPDAEEGDDGDEFLYDEEDDGQTTMVTDDTSVPPLRDLDSAMESVEQVGPPRILRINRESRQKQLSYPPVTERETEEGVFAGKCDFCGREIKPYPDAEAQLYKHSREIFCCDDYQLFMQFALSKPFGKKYDVDVQKFVTAYMDIQPHAPYNRQARKVAKERAALRMREREVARQKKAVSQFQQQNNQQTTNQNNAAGAKDQQHTYQQAAQRALKVINFSLGSKKCAEQGFIVDPSPSHDPHSILSRMGPGGVTVEALDEGLRGAKDTARIQKKGLVQKFYLDDKKLFYVLFKDGSGTVFYPSGRPCILILSTPKVKPPDPFANVKTAGKKSKANSRSTATNNRAVTDDNKSQKSGVTATTNLSTKARGAAATDPGYIGGVGSDTSRTARTDGRGGGGSEDDDDEVGVRKRQFLVFTDEQRSKLLAVFMPDGNAACYYDNKQLRLHLDPFGGILFGENLSKKRKWSWLDFAENHQHAPPLQPLAIALSNQVSLRIANQNAITLAYRSGPHSVKFNVGVKLKITAGKAALPKLFERTEDVVYLSEMQTYTQTIINRISNLLKYKNEDLAERLPPPPYLLHQMEKKGMNPNLSKLTGRHKKQNSSVDHRSNKTPSPEKVQQLGGSQDESMTTKSVAVA